MILFVVAIFSLGLPRAIHDQRYFSRSMITLVLITQSMNWAKEKKAIIIIGFQSFPLDFNKKIREMYEAEEEDVDDNVNNKIKMFISFARIFVLSSKHNTNTKNENKIEESLLTRYR